MNTKFYFRVWVVISGLSFVYGYVRRINLGDEYLARLLNDTNSVNNYNWFDKIVRSINELIAFGNDELAFRITWGLSTMIVIGLSSLLLGLALKWVKNSIGLKGHP
jgi:hypothetical protein